MATADACDTQRVACCNKELMSHFLGFNVFFIHFVPLYVYMPFTAHAPPLTRCVTAIHAVRTTRMNSRRQ